MDNFWKNNSAALAGGAAVTAALNQARHNSFQVREARKNAIDRAEKHLYANKTSPSRYISRQLENGVNTTAIERSVGRWAMHARDNKLVNEKTYAPYLKCFKEATDTTYALQEDGKIIQDLSRSKVSASNKRAPFASAMTYELVSPSTAKPPCSGESFPELVSLVVTTFGTVFLVTMALSRITTGYWVQRPNRDSTAYINILGAYNKDEITYDQASQLLMVRCAMTRQEIEQLLMKADKEKEMKQLLAGFDLKNS